MKEILVLGAGGFIGSHLVRRLKEKGDWVYGVDLKYPEFSSSPADQFTIADLRDQQVCKQIFASSFDEVYQLAADMGGAGYIFSGHNDAEIMRNSSLININVLTYSKDKVGKIFYSSSACIYPAYNQKNIDTPILSEDSAYPAEPDSEYGWEKLFSERLYLAHHRNHSLPVRIARFHNIFGPEGIWRGGKEKAPAAICRKVAAAPNGGTIEIWGDGKQTRSFLYIQECLIGIEKLMKSDFMGPVNIGSEEMVSINELTKTITKISGKKLNLSHINGPQGVRGRNSDNSLIQEKLKWSPGRPLKEGLKTTYQWIENQLNHYGKQDV